MTLNSGLIVLCVVFIVCLVSWLSNRRRIKVIGQRCSEKAAELESLAEQKYLIEQSILELEKQLGDARSGIEKLSGVEVEITNSIASKNDILNGLNASEEQSRKACAEIEDRKRICFDGFDTALNEHHNNTIKKLDEQTQLAKDELAEKQNELNKLVIDITNTARQKRLEFEALQDLELHKLPLTEDEYRDIHLLSRVQKVLMNKEILSKLIWSTFFQKSATELCNRVVGTEDKVCGIYKITNVNNSRVYVGQSVDMSTRWKNHIKSGLGIGASATNKLYKAMKEEGVWNFTFEKIEECSKEDLNEREQFWIAAFESNLHGYNTKMGA